MGCASRCDRRRGGMVWLQPKRSRAGGAAVVLTLAAALGAAGVRGDPTIIHPDVVQWLTAAQQSRADVWFVGDSVANPFDAGFTAAAASHFGLAGTGVGTDFSPDNGHVTIAPSYPLNSNGGDHGGGAVPASRQYYVLSFGEPTTVGSPPNNFPFGYFVNPGGNFDPQAAVDWHFWTASPAAGGSMRAEQLVPASQTVLQTSVPIATATPANGLQHSVVHFNGTSGNAGQTVQGTLIDTSNTSILYSRLTKPGATGATVTTWSYGGHGALDLYNDKYLAGPTSPAGRGQFLGAMTDGGSGKLLVVLEEGTNDASADLANRPSVNGVLP